MSSNLFIIDSNQIQHILNSSVFEDIQTEIIIYQDILLIDPEKIKCKIIGNIINQCEDLTKYNKIFLLGVGDLNNPFLSY